jgi:phosphonate transport system ATP-binding protein
MDSLVCAVGGRTLLEVATLRVQPGERVGIVGPNGAGKSTLLRALSGFMPPTHGQLQVLGRPLHNALPPAELRALRREVGQVLQGLHLVARVNVLDNVLMGALGRITGWRRWSRHFSATEHAQASAALQAVGLYTKATARVDQLSGGERQKVALARLLMQQPRLILADEPTAALDPAAATEVCELLAQAARGATLITVVHNPTLLNGLADRVIGLRAGRIAFDLPLAEVNETQLAQLYRPTPEPPDQRPPGSQATRPTQAFKVMP